MVTGPRDRGAAPVANHARRPLRPLAGVEKGGKAAAVVTNASNLVDLFVTILFFRMVTPAGWPGWPSVTNKGTL